MHGCRRGNEIGVPSCQPAVREQRGVLEPGPNAVAVTQSPLVDCPGGDAVAMMHLFELHSAISEGLLDHRGERDGIMSLFAL